MRVSSPYQDAILYIAVCMITNNAFCVYRILKVLTVLVDAHFLIGQYRRHQRSCVPMEAEGQLGYQDEA